MKKLFLGSFAIVLTMSSYAQSGKVISAYNYLQSYLNKEGASNLVEAAKNIDIAAGDPSTSESTKTWWYRSQVYQSIANERTLADQYPKASLEAMRSFEKMRDLNDPKFKDWKDAYENMKSIAVSLFNNGIDAFNKKNYHDAYLFFMGVSNIQDILTAKGQNEPIKTLTSSLGNAALSAENDKDYPTAIAAYKKLLPVSKDSAAYISLVSLLKKAANAEKAKGNADDAKKYLEEAKAITDQALAKYPASKDLLIDKINFYLTDGKYSDAITYIQSAITQDPKNEQLYAVLGLAYSQTGDTTKARQTYENLLLMNPNNVDANRGLGAMIFNRQKLLQEQINALGATKEDLRKAEELTAKRNAIFLEAKPYLQKALDGKPDDDEIRKILTVIDARTKKD